MWSKVWSVRGIYHTPKSFCASAGAFVCDSTTFLNGTAEVHKLDAEKLETATSGLSSLPDKKSECH